jgi:hypothetical protein
MVLGGLHVLAVLVAAGELPVANAGEAAIMKSEANRVGTNLAIGFSLEGEWMEQARCAAAIDGCITATRTPSLAQQES